MELERNQDVLGLWSIEGEYVQFPNKFIVIGKIEVLLKNLAKKLNQTVLHYLREAIRNYEENQTETWQMDYPSQVVIIINQIAWSSEIETTFLRLNHGYENSMKDSLKKKISQINSLIKTLGEELSIADRYKYLSLCTLDIHSRDIINKLIENKVCLFFNSRILFLSFFLFIRSSIMMIFYGNLN